MTSARDDTYEGKGRVRPGPSPSVDEAAAPNGEARSLAVGRVLRTAGALMVLLAAVAVSVFGTQAHQYSSPAALALVAAFGSFFGIALGVGLPRERASGVREWLPQVLAGAGGFAVAPWLVMANRYTDAPPGSEVAFFSMVTWGAMLVVAVSLASPDRVRRIGGALLALAGAAAVLANWERPSSFSPFVRYAREEVWMLVAGVLWVVLILALLSASRRGTLGPAALRAGLGGVVGAFAITMPALLSGALTAEDFTLPGLWAYGIAVGFLTTGTLLVLRSRSAISIAGAYLLVPSAMSLLLLLERVFGFRGPNPLLMAPILGGTAVVAAGIVLSGQIRSEASSRAAPSRVTTRLARLLAILALVAATVSLALPGTTAAVSATRADGTHFAASFELYGLEVVGTWVALGVACAAMGIALRPPESRRGLYQALASVAAVAAWPFVADTPLRTLTSFIPSDVQVDYGSEFARIDFAGGPSVLSLVALGGALLAVAVTLSRYRPTSLPDSGNASRDDREVIVP